MKQKLLPVLFAAGLTVAAAPAFAQSAGDWTLGLGVHQVDPKSENGTLAGGTLPLSVGSDAKPSLTFEYFIRDNLGIEVLAAWPFQHDISVKGVGRVGSTKHLPPTFSLQYHFNDKGVVSPLVGVGLNYTTFLARTPAARWKAPTWSSATHGDWPRMRAWTSASARTPPSAWTCAGSTSTAASASTARAWARPISTRSCTAPLMS